MSQNTNTQETPGAAPQQAPAYTMDSSSFSRRSALKAMLGVAGAAVLFGNPVSALAKPKASKETTEALAAAQAEFDKVQSQMDSLSSQFMALSQEQDKTIGKIEGVQGKIDKTQSDIEKKQKELEGKQGVLADRVADNYKEGGSNALALLLSSSSFEEMLSNNYYIGKVNEQDQQTIEAVHHVQEELKETKVKFEKQKASLEKLKAEQAGQLKAMKAKKDEVQVLLDGLSSDVRELVVKRDKEILAAAEAEAQVRREQEAERKRLEEEAAANASRPSGGGSTSGSSGGSSTGSSSSGSSSGGGGVTGSGPQGSGSGNLQKAVVNAAYSTGSPGQGLCAMWVSQVFNRAGLGYPTGNADDMYNAWCVSSNRGNLQVGMVVAVSTHSHTWAGQIYGHIGIYVGNGIVRENVGAVVDTPLEQWIAYYGDTVTPRWGWVFGRSLA